MLTPPPPSRESRQIRTVLAQLYRRLLPFLFLLLALTALGAKGLGYTFSGGGARGYAQIGILKVLEENGIYPDYITGTSIGAVIGGLYALGYSATEIDSLMAEINVTQLLDDNYQRGDLYIGQKRWAPYGNLTLDLDKQGMPHLPPSIYSGNKLNLEFARLFLPASAYQDFSSLPIPFACVATDLLTGEPKVFSKGSLMQAVRASISVPSLMKPFQFEGSSYIDGGISQNMPVSTLRDLGADTVIGLKANSTLRSKKQLVDLVDVIDQTINIGIIRNLNASRDDCELLLEPDLQEYSSTDFADYAQIVALGEACARARLPEIIALRDSLLAQGYTFQPAPRAPSPARLRINSIESVGREHISSLKVRDYLGLEARRSYTPEEIFEACKEAWNSQLFRVLYPVLEPEGNGYKLIIHTEERERGHLILNSSYTTEEDLNVGAILSLENIVLKNSRLQAGFTLGGRTEVTLDYVKNFGEFWGSYFRIFPYLSEQRFYLYDAEGFTTSSIKSLEFGITPGVGVFARKIAIAEAFFYTYRTKLYRDVSPVPPIDRLYLISGVGLKAYHESLDDYIFPRRGMRAYGKFNFARWSSLSDQVYTRFTGDLDLYSQINSLASLRLGLNHGTYFGSEQESAVDPFYFSGSHAYRGYQRYAISSPQYSVCTFGLVLNPRRNIFLETGIQGLNLSKEELWYRNQNIEWSAYAEIGIRTLIAPIRFIAALREHGRPNLYLNVGFDYDTFWFSRK